jgi:hypothetical protein
MVDKCSINGIGGDTKYGGRGTLSNSNWVHELCELGITSNQIITNATTLSIRVLEF